ncbi:hypothetical protein [Pedobacter sp.]|uniref:hypothetical protein n=1 Tax=Pedobacter sp. TaxID=1411316 RepID=UPI003D7FFAB4
MNKMIKHSFLVMLAALAMSGCSKDKEIVEPEVPVKEEVVKVDKDITAMTTKIMEKTAVIGTFVSDTTIKMAEGLFRTSIVFKRPDKLPVSMFIIEADLKNAKLELQTISPYNDLIYGVQPISEMAKDNEIAGTKIMAAINGSVYTAAGDPTGILCKWHRR